MPEDAPRVPWEIDRGKRCKDAEIFWPEQASRVFRLAVAILSWRNRAILPLGIPRGPCTSASPSCWVVHRARPRTFFRGPGCYRERRTIWRKRSPLARVSPPCSTNHWKASSASISVQR